MSAWLFDLGNTRLKCAPLRDDGAVGEVLALPHRHDDVAAALERAVPARIDVAYLASVADPALRVAVLQALTARCGRVSLARTQRRGGGVAIAYAQPHRLGVDRYLALIAARERAPGGALVCGVGTALTIDLLDADGCHLGGRIAPSPELMREALHQRAAQLPVGGGAYREFADDTDDALASGCLGAAIALVERSAAEARARVSEPPALLLHGGGAAALRPWLPGALDTPHLVLEGLAVWARDERLPA
jgi:type III pantothenate kinase